MGIRENKVERYLRDELKKLGGDSRKWVSPGRDGVPDQICFVYHQTFFCEVKTIDGRISVAQQRSHQSLINLGAKVITVWGKEGVDLLICDLKRWNRPMNDRYRT